jgi:hypothetical protein
LELKPPRPDRSVTIRFTGVIVSQEVAKGIIEEAEAKLRGQND